MFSPPPAIKYSPLTESNSAEPGLATLPMSAWPEKIPGPSAPKTRLTFTDKMKKASPVIFFMAGIIRGLPFMRFEITQALRNLLFRRRGFVFDDIPFNPGFFGRLQERREKNLALTDGHIIGHVRMAGEQSGGRAFLHALEMHELP